MCEIKEVLRLKFEALTGLIRACSRATGIWRSECQLTTSPTGHKPTVTVTFHCWDELS